MSKITLEDLRAEFEAMRQLYSVTPGGDIAASDVRERYAMAANTLNVALKHGLAAAAMYKLSGGAIDPRTEDRA